MKKDINLRVVGRYMNSRNIMKTKIKNIGWSVIQGYLSVLFL